MIVGNLDSPDFQMPDERWMKDQETNPTDLH